ncbi:MAG TPA: arginine--tRNA ligase [Candidatus Binatia bacterium]|nr:arginine--tRNA ligase [Candidatus Binatia bacterium]
MDFKANITAALQKEVSGEIVLEVPPNSELGDFAFPCFTLAKEKKKNPVQIAQELAKSLHIKGVSRIEAKGPYLNFFVEKGSLAEEVLHAIFKDKNYGSNQSGKGKHALIEHTSINPNASPHVGNARNAMLGDAITRLLRFEGTTVDVHYFVNDIGKQIAILVLASKGKKPSFSELLDLYVTFSKKVEEDKALEKDVFALLKKLEDGDEKVKKQFRDIVDVCVKGQKALLEAFGITFDSFDYESDYLFNKKMDKVLVDLKKTGKLFTDEESRQVLNLEGVAAVEQGMKNAVLVLTRGDGTSLYPLRDIAYAIDKAAWAKDRNMIVLGEDQKLYFQQIVAALNLLRIKAPEPVHYSFIIVADGKMSKRKGTVVLLEDFMREAMEKAEKEILARDKNIGAKELRALAKVIGYGAIKFTILKVSAEKNVTFDWSQALSFEGDSAPYVQYAHARINSILAKAGKTGVPDFKLLTHASESRVITQLGRFPEIVAHAAKNLAPHVLVAYAKELAQEFTSFYHDCPVIQAESKELVASRIALCKATQQVLKTTLSLLGIDAPDAM